VKDKTESKTLRDATWTIVSGIVTAIVALGAYVWELVEGEATFSASAFSGLVTGAIVAVLAGGHFYRRRMQTETPIRQGFVRVQALVAVLALLAAAAALPGCWTGVTLPEGSWTVEELPDGRTCDYLRDAAGEVRSSDCVDKRSKPVGIQGSLLLEACKASPTCRTGMAAELAP
jgi:hypothetical protein